MAVLVLNQQTLDELARIKTFAEKHPFSVMAMVDRLGTYKPAPAPGDYKEHTAEIPVDFAVVFSIEEIDAEGQLCRHVSISHRNSFPPVPMAIEIMKHLGFEKELHGCRVFKEEHSGFKAINIVELIPK